LGDCCSRIPPHGYGHLLYPNSSPWLRLDISHIEPYGKQLKIFKNPIKNFQYIENEAYGQERMTQINIRIYSEIRKTTSFNVLYTRKHLLKYRLQPLVFSGIGETFYSQATAS